MAETFTVNGLETLVVPDTSFEVLLATESRFEILEAAVQGPRGAQGIEGPEGPVGPAGPAGPAGGISTDASNRLRLGGDALLYVPDTLNPDPLAYYILAKS